MKIMGIAKKFVKSAICFYRKYLSKLKMISPQNKPIITAANHESKTVYIAYPPDRVANNPVPNITPPTPAFFDQSVGDILNKGLSTPAQVHKTSFTQPHLSLRPTLLFWFISFSVSPFWSVLDFRTCRLHNKADGDR